MGSSTSAVTHVVSGTARQPGFDLGMLVGGVVVDDEMDVQGFGHVGVDVAQEGEDFLVPMASFALREHFAGGHVQGGEQRSGAVADVIVGDALDVPQPHGQHRLGALQGLDLAFFVHAQHHGVIGRVQIQPDDVADFFDEVCGPETSRDGVETAAFDRMVALAHEGLVLALDASVGVRAGLADILGGWRVSGRFHCRGLQVRGSWGECCVRSGFPGPSRRALARADSASRRRGSQRAGARAQGQGARQDRKLAWRGDFGKRALRDVASAAATWTERR